MRAARRAAGDDARFDAPSLSEASARARARARSLSLARVARIARAGFTTDALLTYISNRLVQSLPSVEINLESPAQASYKDSLSEDPNPTGVPTPSPTVAPTTSTQPTVSQEPSPEPSQLPTPAPTASPTPAPSAAS